ncbi:MAG: T9SS type A sorting domain-containing protein [bacterium]|nr:T9SS type A sorting domain-containing protein [bacterium]
MKKPFLNSLTLIFLFLSPALCCALSTNSDYGVVAEVEDCIPPEKPAILEPGKCGITSTVTGANGGDRTDAIQPTFTWIDVFDPASSMPGWYEVQIDHDGFFSIADIEDVDYDLWITNVTSFNFGTGQDNNGRQAAYLSDRSTPFTGATLPDGIWFWRVRAHDFWWAKAHNPACNWVKGDWSEICYFTIDTVCCNKARLVYPGADTEFCSRQFHVNDCTPTLEWVDLPLPGARPNGLEEPPPVTYKVRIIERNAGVYNAANVINLPGSDADGWVDAGANHSFATTVCLEDSDTAGDFYWWEWRAVDNDGNTGSDSFAFLVDTTPPTMPQILGTPADGVHCTSSTQQLSWDEGDTYSRGNWVDWSAASIALVENNGGINSPPATACIITHSIDLRYDLQIAPIESGWNSPVVDVTELTEPNYEVALADGNYMWRVRAMDCGGNISEWSPAARFEIDLQEGMLETELIHQKVPVETTLYQSYPNPANSKCWIPFALSEKANVRIEIYNLAGRLIRVLEPGDLEPGSYLTRDWAVPWDRCDQKGKEVASGIYFYRFQAGPLVKTRKLIILK